MQEWVAASRGKSGWLAGAVAVAAAVAAAVAVAEAVVAVVVLRWVCATCQLLLRGARSAFQDARLGCLGRLRL